MLEGQLPAGSYEGEQVYLVPLQGATQENVDSVAVEQGTFRFVRESPQPQLFILRMRPQLRLDIQELLVVVEKGEVTVRLDSVSVARGTPLNDTLQEWKEQKAEWDATQRWLRSIFPSANAEQQEEISRRKEEIMQKSSTYNYTFVKNNKDNVVGAFVYSMIKGSLSPEQIETLGMPE